MGFFDFFSNEAETRELHKNIELKSRYYKASFKKIKDQIEVYCKNNKIAMEHIDEAHGEVFLQTSNYHVIVSIVQMNPLESSVDMKVQTYSLIGRNIPKKTILKIYEFLDSKLQFKGTNLHP